jgi:serine/threonine protein kinase
MLAWPQLQGRVVGDGYRLIRFLDGSETSGRFEGKTDGSENANVMVQLFSLTPRQGRERLELWRSLQLLNEPEILKVLASGTADWPDLHFDYLVTELPDESLAGVLHDRVLDDDEARQVVKSVAAALVVMHDHQFVHASVQPSNIYSVGDNIKLSVATVQRPGASDILAEPSAYQAPEVSSFAFSSASDIWSLGVTLFQSLTQQLPGDDAMERAAELSAPFPEILKHSLDPISAKRWSARWILKSLGTPVTEPTPSLDATPPQSSRIDLGRPKGRSNSVFAIAAIILFLAFLWLLFSHKKQPQHPVVGPSRPAAPVATPAPTPVRPTPPPAVVSTPPAGSAATGPVNWRVIAFTYNRETDATHKAAAVNRTHPDLHAEVFSPQSGRFLVSVGGWMPMDTAKRLRQQAISDGLPPDTYAQNFRR